MGGRSGGGVPMASAAEQQQIAMQNQLLQQQLEQAAIARQQEAYKQSPEYLNQQAQQNRAVQEQQYRTSALGAYQQKQNEIKQTFADAGMQGQEAPYLAALQRDYESLQYRPGQAYGYGETPPTAEWDEAGYLAANPDVASSFGFGQGGVHFASGLDHYNRVGKNEGRKGVPQGYGSTATAPVIPGTADSWDDPGRLLSADYIGSIINDTRLGRKDQDYASGLDRGWEQINNNGLDYDTRKLFSDRFNERMQDVYNTSGLSANDYSSVFDPSNVLNSVMEQERNARRTQYTTQARAAFGGIDPNADFADTADDQYISDIVGRQYGDAQSALDRAKARGALTDTGYSSGLSYLGEQRKTADASAQALGGAVLERNRGTLGGIKNNALNAAGSYDFGQQFDTNTFLNDYTSKKGSLTEGLGGEINNALAGQNWFDVGSVLTKAGYAQGAQNTAPLMGGFGTPQGAAIAGARDEDKNKQRGLGGAGVF